LIKSEINIGEYHYLSKSHLHKGIYFISPPFVFWLVIISTRELFIFFIYYSHNTQNMSFLCIATTIIDNNEKSKF